MWLTITFGSVATQISSFRRPNHNGITTIVCVDTNWNTWNVETMQAGFRNILFGSFYVHSFVYIIYIYIYI
jgi:hypothetical protein